MLIDLTCPAELFRTALPTDEDPSCELLLYNLSDRIIVSAEVTLRLLNRRDEEEERLVYRARALNGRPQSAFPMRVPCTPSPAIRKADVTIEKIWFSDNAVWRRDAGTEVSYTPNALPVSRGLTNLKYVAGESAVGYPSQQEGLWVCVCGRPNSDADEYCVRCRREKQLIFARYNREAVEKQLNQKERQLELLSRSAREDTARMQRIREEAYQTAKLKKGRRIHLAAGLLAAVAVVALALFAGAPAARLLIARRTLAEGQPEAARDILEELGAFPGAESLLADARYALAAEQLQTGSDPESLRAAAETLRADGREGAEALAQEADFKRAQLLLEAGDFAGCREAARSLSNAYPGLKELLLETDYQEALYNMNQRYYVLARNAFLNLGDYRDSAAQADACIYLPALALMENEEYDAAKTQFSRIPDYEDSSELIQKCDYLKGMVLEKKEDLAGAAAAYFAAGDYEDAQEKARELTYILAEDAFTAASFEKAAAFYQRIPGYRDSNEKALASIYTLAKRAISDLEYNQGLSLLARLPADYEDVSTLYKQTVYALGLEAQEQEDWLTAAERFLSIPGYRDANRRAERALARLTPDEAALFEPEQPSEEPAEQPSPGPASAEETAAAEPTDAPAEIEAATPVPAEAPSPAELPTAAPTEKPTAAPTAAPTEKPTAAPTAAPTEKPTAAPTAAPTEKPAPSPTRTPVRVTARPNAGAPEATDDPNDSFLVKDEE